MNKKILLLIAVSVASSSMLFAQNWTIGGNNLAANSKFGATNKKDIIFVTDDKNRGGLTRAGLWGFGLTDPTALIHANSLATQDALRVQTDGTTRLYVASNGGVAIGSLTTGPTGGLYVSGNTGLGISSPTEKLHVIGNILSTGTAKADSVRSEGGITAAGNLDVSGTVGFGSVETFSDGGAFTIQSNSDIVPDADGTNNLGTTARTWGSVHSLAYLNTPPPNALKTAQNLKAGLPEIMKLRPVSYTDGDMKKFALIGAEVKTVLPEVTSETELSATEGVSSKPALKKVPLSMEYDALIPVLIKGMQQQQEMLTAMQERINQLETALTAANSASSENMRTASKVIGAALEQNQPNPFNQSTVIRYRLPQGTNGTINIYGNGGVILKSLKANESGQATINANDLKPGTYTYTLSVNGKQVDSKKLVVVN